MNSSAQDAVHPSHGPSSSDRTQEGGSPASVTRPLQRLVRAGILCALVDLTWAIVLTLAYGRTIGGMLRGIATTALGPRMADGGAQAAAVGLGLHVSVAFWWSGVFLALVLASPRLRRMIASPRAALGVAAVYGPAIWIAMSVVVIPVLTGRPPVLGPRWFVQLGGHAAFVGLPIVWGIRDGASRSAV